MPIERDLNAYASMTRWFSPSLLVLAGYRDIVARVFGQFSDQRSLQHVADPIPHDPALKKKFVLRHDYSDEASGNAPFWVDFVADLGDGFDSTYAVAYMVAAAKLHGENSGPIAGIHGIKGLQDKAGLDHGRLLVFCGDEVYPWPTHDAYDQKTFGPYALALPQPSPDPKTRVAPPPSRDVFAIPGNHDWYDGLNTFDDKFCRARATGSTSEGRGLRFGDWQTRQHRSSFAIKLPHNWWIWGADIQLNNLLDTGQLEYFRTVAEHMGPDDRFILCTAEPTWYALGTPEERFARENLGALIEAPIRKGAKLCGIFSGDWHHYSRYNESEHLGNMNLITAGGGGAYIHGTYHLKRDLKFEWIDRLLNFRLDRKLEPSSKPEQPEPTQSTRNACYPSKAASVRMALGNWLFPKRNFGFCMAMGLIYCLLTWTFANLRVDFWLDVPPGAQIERGLVQTPRALRECLQKPGGAVEAQTPRQTTRRSSVEPSNDVATCLLATGSRSFAGTGIVEEWTLQLIDFYMLDRATWDKTGHLLLKGVHLLLLGIVNSVSAAAFLLAVWAAFFAITQTKSTGNRGLISRALQASLHFGAHLLLMWALFCCFVYVNDRYLEPFLVSIATTAGPPPTLFLAPVSFWADAVFPLEMMFVGGLLGGLIFGFYLMAAYLIGRINCDWIFSSQRIADYRCFLRMRFEADKLTVYPIRIDSVPARTGWRWRKNPMPGEPLVEPKTALKPRLIEGPLVIRPAEVHNLPR